MNLLRYSIRFALLFPALALTGCDAGTEGDDTPDPSGFPGDARLLGMWAEPDDGDGYQDFSHVAYDEEGEVLRIRNWEYDTAAECFDPSEDEVMFSADDITETTIDNGDGTLSTYSFTDGGNTLRIVQEDPDDEPQVLTRSSRTPDSMMPNCANAEEPLVGLWQDTSPFGGTTRGYLQIYDDLSAEAFAYHTGAGCWEQHEGLRMEFEPLGGTTYVEHIVWPGGSTARDTVSIRLSEDRLEIEPLDYDTSPNGYRGHVRSAEDQNPVCDFRLVATHRTSRINGAPLPYTYTATDESGVTHTYRVEYADLYLWHTGSAYLALYRTEGGARADLHVHGDLNVTSGEGAFEVTFSYPENNGVTLSGAAGTSSLAATLEHPGLSAPMEFDMAPAAGFAPELSELHSDDFAAVRRLTLVR
jgi:hypothetical protein